MCTETDWITAIAALGATATSVIAAFIAWKAAAAADRSAEFSAKTLHRSAIREVVSESHELIEEELRIASLHSALRGELTTQLTFSGSLQNSGIELLRAQFEKDASSAAEQTVDAKALVTDPEKLINASANDLDLWQAKIEEARSKLRTIRESMSRELERLRSQNLQSRGRGR